MSGISPISGLTYYPYNISGMPALVNNVKSSIESIHKMNSIVSDANFRRTPITGSYGGLMQAYYGKNHPVTPSTDLFSKLTAAESIPDAISIRKQAAKLENTTEKMIGNNVYKVFEQREVRDIHGNVTSVYDKSRIYDAVVNYTKDYNDTLVTANMSKDDWTKKAVGEMRQITQDNKADLYNVGITMDYSGKMHVNQTRFMNAEMSDVNDLFGNRFSYAGQISMNSSHIQNRVNNLFSKLTHMTYGKGGYYSMDVIGALGATYDTQV